MCVRTIYMLRWRKWRLKYVGAQDRALRDWWLFLEMVFVGECEVFVCLGFVEIISFLYFFPWPRSP